MKRTVLLAIFSLCAIAAVTAQGWGRGWNLQPPPMDRNDPRTVQRPALENVRASGPLSIDRGMIAIKSAEVTYFVIGLNRFIGFIDGLREGAVVAIDGKAAALPGDNRTKILYPEKMTLNGREYDLALPGTRTPSPAPTINRNAPAMPGPMMRFDYYRGGSPMPNRRR